MIWSFFGAELASFRGKHGFKSFSNTIVGWASLNNCFYFTRKHILFAHPEVHTTVFFDSFIISTGWITWHQKRRFTWRIIFCIVMQGRDCVKFLHFVHVFSKVRMIKSLRSGNSIVRIIFQQFFQKWKSVRIHSLILTTFEGNITFSILF